uniref:Glycoprotein endo-alpha-1,2-mannosidase-like protein n=1 Tax=Macrostomum lignano TaxID=282301 RepID=A0A1I8GVY9_9PLAT
ALLPPILRRVLLKRRLLARCLALTALIGCIIWLAGSFPQPPPPSQSEAPAAQAKDGMVVSSLTPAANQNRQSLPNYRVHIFYYAWYGEPGTDGAWLHWNHSRLPHWNAERARKFSQAGHTPPGDIGANFYPELGPYSSANISVVRRHFAQIRRSGAGTVVVSWYPPGMADENGRPVDRLVPMLLSAAREFQLRLALHIEPYAGRSPANLRRHLRYIAATHARHPAFYRERTRDGRWLPVHYIYDSYRIPHSLWRPLLLGGSLGGSASIRGKPENALMFGLAMSIGDCQTIKESGFDGAYTYFAADGFTQASTRSNWAAMSRQCSAAGVAFAPSIGPGYIDTAVRPWNAENTRQREGGRYYTGGLRAAIAARPAFLSITSFNEWHEGTQIEPAAPRHGYLDYTPRKRDHYLDLTAQYAALFKPDTSAGL